MLKYKKSNIAYAKELRKNMTEQERKLWYNFLKKYPVRFQRQKAIDNFIADFYCASVRLAILFWLFTACSHFQNPLWAAMAILPL